MAARKSFAKSFGNFKLQESNDIQHPDYHGSHHRLFFEKNFVKDGWQVEVSTDETYKELHFFKKKESLSHEQITTMVFGDDSKYKRKDLRTIHEEGKKSSSPSEISDLDIFRAAKEETRKGDKKNEYMYIEGSDHYGLKARTLFNKNFTKNGLQVSVDTDETFEEHHYSKKGSPHGRRSTELNRSKKGADDRFTEFIRIEDPGHHGAKHRTFFKKDFTKNGLQVSVDTDELFEEHHYFKLPNSPHQRTDMDIVRAAREEVRNDLRKPSPESKANAKKYEKLGYSFTIQERNQRA